MKNKYFFLAICFTVIFFSACSETGLEGPEGPQGKTGDAGAVGPAGKDGSTMYSGNGVPANSIGINGDYYLDKNTGDLYGPKAVGAWGTPTVLRGTNGTNGSNGSNGTNGTNGSTTLSGNGTPSAATGIVGDYFLDKTNYLLYGPKTAAGWGIPILLRGADGTQGPTGPAGKDGSIIYSGSGAPVSTIGVNGDYYLDKNTGNLYGPKTAAGWGAPTLLKGTNGTNGTNGSTTLSGSGAPSTGIGAIGDYYLDRSSYLLYGPKAVNGWGVGILLRGADGAQGPTGPAGADGTIIYSGETAPDNALGKNGDFYISRLPLAFYGPKSNLGWGIGTNLKGADGSNGTNGVNGNSILNGAGAPMSTIGKDGDFYIDITTYMIYGPKTGGINWGFGTSLKGADGTGGNTIVLETDDVLDSLKWVADFPNYNKFNLKKQKYPSIDTATSVFTIPAAHADAAKNGSVIVYVRSATPLSNNLNPIWRQLNFTVKDDMGNSLVHTSAFDPDGYSASSLPYVRIYYDNIYSSTHQQLYINKVRIVIMPPGISERLNINPRSAPYLQTIQKLNVRDKDFIKLK